MSLLDNSIAVPLEDICIDFASPKITTPIPCSRFSSARLDPLEYAMGYSRGEMDALAMTEKSFNIKVLEDVFESLFKDHSWGIMHTQEELERLFAFFRANYDAGVKNRVWYAKEFPTQPSYTYRLFFNQEYVQVYLEDGRPCIPSDTGPSHVL
ncbi:hypothetical protein BDZ89DRAFT_1166508 [Hymenopellis radicata]|nr:hypothetical protein BDZ89DRAFT_1166508 [Hymenopellis radicata]